MRGGVATATDKHAMATCIFSEEHDRRDGELQGPYQRDDGCAGASQRHDVEVVGEVELRTRRREALAGWERR